jgi:hypothetical protein
MNTTIEEIIKFNNDLIQGICDSDSDEDEDQCLITGEKLHERHIELECTHKFNYDAILNEVIVQKKGSHLESHRVNKKQLKCPYCRNIQQGILPWRANYEKKRGVNWPPSYVYKANICATLLKSGKRKGEACGKKCAEKLCPRHLSIHLKKEHEQRLVALKGDTGPASGCVAILRSGKNKGKACRCKVKFIGKDKKGFCGKHKGKEIPPEIPAVSKKNMIISTSTSQISGHLYGDPTIGQSIGDKMTATVVNNSSWNLWGHCNGKIPFLKFNIGSNKSEK